MAKFVKGDIVIIPFPFSDLTHNKRRPVLIISVLNGDDLILCQITSQNVKDNYAIPIEDRDFKSGELRQAAISGQTVYSQQINILFFIRPSVSKIKNSMKLLIN